MSASVVRAMTPGMGLAAAAVFGDDLHGRLPLQELGLDRPEREGLLGRALVDQQRQLAHGQQVVGTRLAPPHAAGGAVGHRLAVGAERDRLGHAAVGDRLSELGDLHGEGVS